MDLITLTPQDILRQILWTLWNSASAIIEPAMDRVLKFFWSCLKIANLFYFNIYITVTHFYMIRIIIKCIITRNSFSDPKIITEVLVIIWSMSQFRQKKLKHWTFIKSTHEVHLPNFLHFPVWLITLMSNPNVDCVFLFAFWKPPCDSRDSFPQL